MNRAFELLFSEKNIRKIWKELRNSYIPVVTEEEYLEVGAFRQTVLAQFRSNAYVPSIGHGYLGFPKSNGCTRFVPILSKEDMAVYYLISLALQPALAHDQPNIFGGWHRPPENIAAQKKEHEKTAESEFVELLADPYLAESMSKPFWFKNWTNFNALLLDSVNSHETGNFVMTTDIANFYDTIDIYRLCKSVRSVTTDAELIVDLLEYFLSYWDRRVKGYKPSSKGIPQEIIGDASRLYSHFYLKPFDLEFTEHCNKQDVLFIRWADDMILIGNSAKSLERCIHFASKSLLRLGLNLNSSKTKLYAKSEFKMYRGLEVLSAVQNKNPIEFNSAFRRFCNHHKRQPSRADTVSKVAATFMLRNGLTRTSANLSNLADLTKDYDIVSTYAFNHIKNLIQLFGGNETLNSYAKVILAKPYAAPKAQLLKFLWHYPNAYRGLGLTKRGIAGVASRIFNASEDSEIVQKICYPKFQNRHKELLPF